MVAHKDRLWRFGYELIDYIIRKAEGEIIILDHENTELQDFKSAETLIKSSSIGIKGDLYITGVALDYCVIDTAITGRHSGKFNNIYWQMFRDPSI